MKDQKKIKEIIIQTYEELLENAVKNEDYEAAAKYKKWLDNLKKINN